jgi:hypothetical protein
MPPPAGLDEGLARPRRPRLAPLGWGEPLPKPLSSDKNGNRWLVCQFHMGMIPPKKPRRSGIRR